MGQLLDNKEMFIVMAIFVITTLVVYQVRRLKINNSWTVATIAGGLIQLVALVVAYLVLGLPEKIIWLVLSTVVAIFAGVVIQFIFMNLDYARTENVDGYKRQRLSREASPSTIRSEHVRPATDSATRWSLTRSLWCRICLLYTSRCV